MKVAGRRMLVLILAAMLLLGSGWGGLAAPRSCDEQSAVESSCCCGSTAAAARERCCCCAPRLADEDDAPPPTHQVRCLCGSAGLPPLAPGQAKNELRLRAEAPASASCPAADDSGIGLRGAAHLAWLQERPGVLPPVRVLYCVWQT